MRRFYRASFQLDCNYGVDTVKFALQSSSFSFSIIRTAGVCEVTCAKFYGAQKRFKPQASRYSRLLSLMRASFYSLVFLIEGSKDRLEVNRNEIENTRCASSLHEFPSENGVSDVIPCRKSYCGVHDEVICLITIWRRLFWKLQSLDCRSRCLTALHLTGLISGVDGCDPHPHAIQSRRITSCLIFLTCLRSPESALQHQPIEP
jgi:hypothetical protein